MKYENNRHDLCYIIIAIFINWIWGYPNQNGHPALWKSKPKPSDCDTVLVRHWAAESCRVTTECNVIPSVTHDRLFSKRAPVLEGLASNLVLKRIIPDWGLSPCDFDLIPKMKEPLRGIRFRTVPEILQAVDRSIRTMNTTGAAKGILRLPHRWQRVVHNAGDYSEGQ